MAIHLFADPNRMIGTFAIQSASTGECRALLCVAAHTDGRTWLELASPGRVARHRADRRPRGPVEVGSARMPAKLHCAAE